MHVLKLWFFRHAYYRNAAGNTKNEVRRKSGHAVGKLITRAGYRQSPARALSNKHIAAVINNQTKN
jgi:hypothetical protein